MPLSSQKKPDPLSRTAVKKQAEGLQDLGKKLLELPAAQLAKIALPEELLEAIQFFHSIKAHEAKRRQLQYIGKMMRKVDSLPIEASLSQLKSEHKRQLAHFHKLEVTRDELIEKGDEALHQFMVEFPSADRQYLRQLIRKGQQDRALEKNSGALSELFKYLKEVCRKE